jgi:hypothetical protein
MSREVFTVRASDFSAGDSAKRVARFAGVDGGVPHRGWTFRLTFSGMTMTTACTLCALGPVLDYRITAGSADGTYDLPMSAGDLNLAGCGADMQFAGPSWVVYNGSSGTCVAATADSGSQLVAVMDFHFRARRVVVRLAATNGTSLSASNEIYYFEQDVDICSFEDGLVLNNRITAAGCYTPLLSGSVGVPTRVNAGARGGTCTITRLACA